MFYIPKLSITVSIYQCRWWWLVPVCFVWLVILIVYNNCVFEFLAAGELPLVLASACVFCLVGYCPQHALPFTPLSYDLFLSFFCFNVRDIAQPTNGIIFERNEIKIISLHWNWQDLWPILSFSPPSYQFR